MLTDLPKIPENSILQVDWSSGKSEIATGEFRELLVSIDWAIRVNRAKEAMNSCGER